MKLYCLKKGELTEAKEINHGYHCPYCGPLTLDIMPYHVLNPSAPLLQRLQPNTLHIDVSDRIGIEDKLVNG